MKNLQRIKGKDIPISSPGASDEATGEEQVNKISSDAFSVKDENTGEPEEIEIILALHQFHIKTKLSDVDPKVLYLEGISCLATWIFRRELTHRMLCNTDFTTGAGAPNRNQCDGEVFEV